MSPLLSAGTPAPDFTLPSGPNAKYRLADSRGHPVILAFYPADWSPVCGDELAVFNEVHAASLGIDPVWAAAARAQGLFRERVREDFASGVKSGVNGTPTFFINGVRYDGLLHPTAMLEALVLAATPE